MTSEEIRIQEDALVSAALRSWDAVEGTYQRLFKSVEDCRDGTNCAWNRPAMEIEDKLTDDRLEYREIVIRGLIDGARKLYTTTEEAEHV
jgi:hypothetical protein